MTMTLVGKGLVGVLIDSRDLRSRWLDLKREEWSLDGKSIISRNVASWCTVTYSFLRRSRMMPLSLKIFNLFRFVSNKINCLYRLLVKICVFTVTDHFRVPSI